MAADLCTVALVGRLTRDPELRSVGDTSVLSGRLAWTRREKRGTEWEDVSNFIDVTLAWGSRADGLAKYLAKGSRIGVTGSLRWREWQTKDGDKRQTIEVDARDVQMLDGKREDAPHRPDMPVSNPTPASADDDSIPF